MRNWRNPFRYGIRLPKLSLEVFRPLAEADTAAGVVGAVTLTPASGEAALATSLEHLTGKGASGAENCNALADVPDIDVAPD